MNIFCVYESFLSSDFQEVINLAGGPNLGDHYRKVRVIEDRDFQRFIEDYVVQGDGDQKKYPDEQLLIDKRLHKIYHSYQRELFKARKYVTKAK